MSFKICLAIDDRHSVRVVLEQQVRSYRRNIRLSLMGKGRFPQHASYGMRQCLTSHIQH